jgi:hypothetical protein
VRITTFPVARTTSDHSSSRVSAPNESVPAAIPSIVSDFQPRMGQGILGPSLFVVNPICGSDPPC